MTDELRRLLAAGNLDQVEQYIRGYRAHEDRDPRRRKETN